MNLLVTKHFVKRPLSKHIQSRGGSGHEPVLFGSDASSCLHSKMLRYFRTDLLLRLTDFHKVLRLEILPVQELLHENRHRHPGSDSTASLPSHALGGQTINAANLTAIAQVAVSLHAPASAWRLSSGQGSADRSTCMKFFELPRKADEYSDGCLSIKMLDTGALFISWLINTLAA